MVSVVLNGILIIVFRLFPNVEDIFFHSEIIKYFMQPNLAENIFTSERNNVLSFDKSGGFFPNANVSATFMGISSITSATLFKIHNQKKYIYISLFLFFSIFFTGSKIGIILAIFLIPYIYISFNIFQAKTNVIYFLIIALSVVYFLGQSHTKNENFNNGIKTVSNYIIVPIKSNQNWNKETRDLKKDINILKNSNDEITYLSFSIRGNTKIKNLKIFTADKKNMYTFDNKWTIYNKVSSNPIISKQIDKNLNTIIILQGANQNDGFLLQDKRTKVSFIKNPIIQWEYATNKVVVFDIKINTKNGIKYIRYTPYLDEEPSSFVKKIYFAFYNRMKNLWIPAYKAFLKNPIKGQGFGNWNQSFENNSSYWSKLPPHNTLIYLWSQSGFFALIFGLVFMIYVLYFCIKLIKYQNTYFLAKGTMVILLWMFIHGLGTNYGLLGERHMLPLISTLLGLLYFYKISDSDTNTKHI